jgi:predicted phosphodiesterase
MASGRKLGHTRAVKLGIFTDVHGDFASLVRVLKRLEKLSVDRLLCLGDLVVHGQRPNEVIQTIRQWAIPTVGGNHDHGAVNYGKDDKIVFFNPKSELHTRLTQQHLTPEHQEFLDNLPEQITPHPEVTAVHAGYEDRYTLLHNAAHVQRTLALAPTPVTLSGHVHCTRIHIQTPEGLEMIDPWQQAERSWTQQMDWSQNKYIISCGNTSQLLFDRLPSVCAVLDTEEQTMYFERVFS